MNARLLALLCVCSLVASVTAGTLAPGTYVGFACKARNQQVVYGIRCDVATDGTVSTTLLDSHPATGITNVGSACAAVRLRDGGFLSRVSGQFRVRGWVKRDGHIITRLTLHPSINRHTPFTARIELQPVPPEEQSDTSFGIEAQRQLYEERERSGSGYPIGPTRILPPTHFTPAP